MGLYRYGRRVSIVSDKHTLAKLTKGDIENPTLSKQKQSVTRQLVNVGFRGGDARVLLG